MTCGSMLAYCLGALMSCPSNRISVIFAGLLEDVEGNQEIEYLWKPVVGLTPDGNACDVEAIVPVLVRTEIVSHCVLHREFG